MLSKEPGKESLNTTPWRRAGRPAVAAGMERGEVCGETEAQSRGACGTLLEVASRPSDTASAGSGVTALTVCRNAPRRLLAEGLSAPRGDGTSESGGRTDVRGGRSGRGGTRAPWGLLPREWDLPSMATGSGLVSPRSLGMRRGQIDGGGGGGGGRSGGRPWRGSRPEDGAHARGRVHERSGSPSLLFSQLNHGHSPSRSLWCRMRPAGAAQP